MIQSRSGLLPRAFVCGFLRPSLSKPSLSQPMNSKLQIQSTAIWKTLDCRIFMIGDGSKFEVGLLGRSLGLLRLYGKFKFAGNNMGILGNYPIAYRIDAWAKVGYAGVNI